MWIVHSDRMWIVHSDRMWIVHSDADIVKQFSLTTRGLLGYYSGAKNKKFVGYLYYLLKYSCFKTLACKHKTTIRDIVSKYQNTITQTQTHQWFLILASKFMQDKVTLIGLLQNPSFAKFPSLHSILEILDNKGWQVNVNPKSDYLDISLSKRTRSKLLFSFKINGSQKNIEIKIGTI